VSDGWLRHPLLADFEHGFGTKACSAPARLVRPKQVHGRAVLRVGAADAGLLGDADAVVCDVAGLPIGVVTADCLPVLIATPSGAVAAAHAGWRGLAAGVLEAALDALAAIAPDVERAAAVIGPHVGASCYEVDAPVLDALAGRFAAAVGGALTPTRPGRGEIDLARLAALDLVHAGLAAERVAILADACTACDRERFHSYRRDGPGSGRLFHFIAART
jgi:purine-nucleoside/S-methyl-5'-thioadenosine phosphorylase / adenosine deaminase